MQSINRYNEKTVPIERIEFGIISNKEVKNMSVFGRDNPGLQKPDLYDNTVPSMGGLIDPHMGVSENKAQCVACGFLANYCVGHFGHMDLSEPVFHMGFYDYVIKILKCVCVKCSKLLIHTKIENEVMELLNKKGKNRLQEISNLVKNTTHCSKHYNGCGAPVAKIIPDIQKKTAIVNIIAEYPPPMDAKKSSDIDDKKPLRQNITAEMAYNILKNISDTDSRILGFDPEHNRPEDLILTCFPVPPVPMRPSVRGDFGGSSTKEDSLTVKLADILKANNRIHKQKETKADDKYMGDNISYLQYHVAVYFDNESLQLPQSDQKGIPIKSLSSRLKGKEGRIRNNLMGKRVNFSARTVITPDPTLSLNELGVPIAVAKNLTFPEITTPYNIEYLQKLVRNGRNKYPGANFVIKATNPDSPYDIRYTKNIELKYGDIVERHLINGDFVLFNRQPTLHKQSMMGHKIRVIDNPNLCTFRLNPMATTPYNADKLMLVKAY